jgi:ABC-type branched-subunit amino acid transport system ATPase component/predicted MFS family arabinose efflux permease
VLTPAAAERISSLTPALTPRPRFHVTRKLVGVAKWPLVLLTAVYTINVSDQFLLSSMFPLLKREFGLSDTALGILSGSYLISVTLGTVPFGALADRYSRTRIIAWGTAFWGITMIFTGMASGFIMLLLGRMVLGLWDPCDNPTSQSLLADYYPVNQRSKVMGIYQMGQLTGFFLLPIGGLMGQAWGWRATFFFFALPAFAVALLSWRLPEPVRGIQERRHQRLEADESTVIASKYQNVTVMDAYRVILRCRSYTASLVSSTVGSLFFGGIGVWTPTFLIRYHDLDVAEATTALSLVAVGGLVGVLTAGNLADFLTHSGYTSARIGVAGIARLISAPLFIAAFLVSYTPLMLVLLSFGALFLVAAIPPLNAARVDVLHPDLRGRGTSLDAVTQSLASAASPVIYGIIADASDLRTAYMVLIPLAAVAGLILMTFALASYRRDEQAVQTMVRDEHAQHIAGLAEAGESAGLSVVGQPASSEASGADESQADADDADAAEEAQPLLRIEALDFSYGPIQVLFGVDLTVPEGGCHALVGRNGVGKTTLLANIGGLLHAQSGQMFLRDQDLVGIPPEQRAKLGITLMAAGQSIFPSLSVSDNLWVGAYPFAGSQSLVTERMEEVLDVFPALGQRLDQRAGTLSGGEQQMVALGRALVAGPDLLLIDELSLGLAPTVTVELLEVVERISGLGTTILLVEQSIGVALSVADSVFFMDRGRVSDLGPASALDADALALRLLESHE